QAAREAITLLKNENNLAPLDAAKLKSIAVIGPNAHRMLLGGYSGLPKHNVTVLEGIKARVGDQIKVLYAEGCKITEAGSWQQDEVIPSDPAEDRRRIAEASEVAKQADVVVEAMLATGRPVIVFLFNGRPLSINKVAKHVPVIFECWYLGQECGRAVADVLFGDVNPGGKLPISIPRSVGHLPVFYNHKPSARRGYLWDDVSPLFSFGFGLGYTAFQLKNVRLAKKKIARDGSTRLLVDVTNTGKRAGSEVVQMYVRDCVSAVTRPIKELKGFKKVWLQPGETKTVALDITAESLAFYDLNMKYGVEPGDFEIMVGNSSRDADLQKVVLTVTKQY